MFAFDVIIIIQLSSKSTCMQKTSEALNIISVVYHVFSIVLPDPKGC